MIIWKRSESDPKTIRKWSENDPKTIRKWSGNDPKTIGKRSESDPKTIRKQTCCKDLFFGSFFHFFLSMKIKTLKNWKVLIKQTLTIYFWNWWKRLINHLVHKYNVKVLELTGLNCPAILQKGKAIIDGGFPTHQPLQHMQVNYMIFISLVITLFTFHFPT